MIIFPDISTYQDSPDIRGDIDFAKMKTMTNAVIIRAGIGEVEDLDFRRNWKLAGEAGLWRGAYWAYKNHIAPRKQADKFAAVIFNASTDGMPDFGVYADFEDERVGSYDSEVEFRQFMDALRINFSDKINIGIYTRAEYWKRHVKPIGYWAQYLFWVAQYKVSKPTVPSPWLMWNFWQFTDTGDGAAYGVESKEIDLNYYNGSWSDFAKEFNLIASNNPPAPTQDKTVQLHLTLSDGKVTGTYEEK